MKKIRKISIKDIEIISYSIQIPILNEGVVDDSFAYCLERDLNDNGFPTKFISLDDMGFISISFNNLSISQAQIKAVIRYANENLQHNH